MTNYAEKLTKTASSVLDGEHFAARLLQTVPAIDREG